MSLNYKNVLPKVKPSEPAQFSKSASNAFSRSLPAFFLAILVHLTILVFLPKTSQNLPKKPAPHFAQIAFKTKNKKKADSPDLQQKQVVSIVPDQEQKRPDEAKYLAEYDQSAKKDQISSQTSLKSPKLSSTPLKKATPALPEPAKQEQVPRKPSLPTIDDYFATPKAEGQNGQKHDPLGLMPTIAGNSSDDAMPFGDDLPGVEKGNSTELNAWQWQHAPFFNRIKSRIARVWSPQSQISRYDPQGALIGQKDRVTVMRVSLDKRGNLASISVASSSGVAYLDEEAERAFVYSTPFPFPPKELFNDKDIFTFEFAFHLQLNKGLSFDFEWGPGG